MLAFDSHHDALIAPLFDAQCVSEFAPPALVDDQLFPDERDHIAGSVPKRRAEFGTARVCARRALQRLGVAPVSLVPMDDRAPRWPQGIVGSITHTTGYCAVVVARADRFRSLGLDVEQDKVLSPEIIRMICTERERLALGLRAARDAIVYFAAKEAFYKCQYPLTRRFLDFQDVELTVDFEQGRFRTRVLSRFESQPACLERTSGRFVRRSGLVACGLAFEAE